MANNRVFFPIQAVGFGKNGVVDSSGLASGILAAHGVQSVSTTTTFNLEQVNELGQLEVYENIETVPDIELNIQKVLDAHPLIYHLATQTAVDSTLVGRSTVSALVQMNIYNDTQAAATGTPLSTVQISGMFVSSLTYTLNVDGNSTEDVQLVGNNKLWSKSAFPFVPIVFGSDAPLNIAGSGGVQRREDVLMGTIAGGGSTWPGDIPGVVGNENVAVSGVFPAHIQTVTITSNFGRDDLFELGSRDPYFRFINFPVDVTCAIDITTSEGDLVDAEANPLSGSNLADQPIIIKMREGTTIDLGTKNKLSSIDFSGGDSSGGNVITTFNYLNQSFLTVTHPQDPAGL